MGTTARGFTYPGSTDDVRPYEDIQTAVQSIDSYLDGRLPARIATNTRTTVSSGITTTETVIDSVTAALVSGRTYKVRWTAAIGVSVAGDTSFVRLREDNLAGTQMNILRVHGVSTGGTGTRWPAEIEAEYTAASTGNKTFVGTLVRATGTGSHTIQGDSSFPVLLTVEYVSG